ncbi:MAG: phosphate ABC transporter permease PstA [Anaerofustis sp.]
MKRSHHLSKFADTTATVILYFVAGFFLLLLAAFTVYILYKGVVAFNPRYMGFRREGIGVQLFNTIYLVLISLLISVPIGIAAGIYISEYAKENALTRFLRVCIETLSSLPSIVVGMFGYLVFLVMTGAHWNLMAGALTISILNIPQMATVTKDALQNVPSIYREGSYSLGATHWQTIWKMMLPSITPRIITGIIISAGRGFGEAAALLFTSGMSSDVNFHNWNPFDINSPLNPFRPADTLAVRIWALKTEGVEPNAMQLADLSTATLLILVFGFSWGARLIGRHLERKMAGKQKQSKRKEHNMDATPQG